MFIVSESGNATLFADDIIRVFNCKGRPMINFYNDKDISSIILNEEKYEDIVNNDFFKINRFIKAKNSIVKRGFENKLLFREVLAVCRQDKKLVEIDDIVYMKQTIGNKSNSNNSYLSSIIGDENSVVYNINFGPGGKEIYCKRDKDDTIEFDEMIERIVDSNKFIKIKDRNTNYFVKKDEILIIAVNENIIHIDLKQKSEISVECQSEDQANLNFIVINSSLQQ